jgi:TetR/AcrR family transcriptional regulator, repressor of fatR-cypB operon
MKPKDEQKEKDLLDAALRLVVRTGIAGVTIKDIAREAGLGVGTVYVYFKSKEEILERLFVESKNVSTRVYFSNLQPGEPFKISFKKIWLNILQHRLTNYKEAVFTEMYYHSHLISPETKERTDTLLLPLFRLMEEGKEQQLVKNINTLLLLTYMVGPIVELVNLHVNGEVKIDQEVINQAFQLTWDGIKA